MRVTRIDLGLDAHHAHVADEDQRRLFIAIMRKNDERAKGAAVGNQCIACGNPYSGDEERAATGAQF